jgi:hypothetical protein
MRQQRVEHLFAFGRHFEWMGVDLIQNRLA